MTMSPMEVVKVILANPTDLGNVTMLVSDDITYVSLNDDNADLKRIMPWCGTSHGAEAIVRTFVDVARRWDVLSFDMGTTFGEGENVAVFGHFTYRSTVMAKVVTSPFAVLAKVTGGRCTSMQFMEDTFATAASFHKGGHWTFRSDPDGAEVTI